MIRGFEGDQWDFLVSYTRQNAPPVKTPGGRGSSKAATTFLANLKAAFAEQFPNMVAPREIVDLETGAGRLETDEEAGPRVAEVNRCLEKWVNNHKKKYAPSAAPSAAPSGTTPSPPGTETPAPTPTQSVPLPSYLSFQSAPTARPDGGKRARSGLDIFRSENKEAITVVEQAFRVEVAEGRLADTKSDKTRFMNAELSRTFNAHPEKESYIARSEKEKRDAEERRIKSREERQHSESEDISGGTPIVIRPSIIEDLEYSLTRIAQEYAALTGTIVFVGYGAVDEQGGFIWSAARDPHGHDIEDFSHTEGNLIATSVTKRIRDYYPSAQQGTPSSTAQTHATPVPFDEQPPPPSRDPSPPVLPSRPSTPPPEQLSPLESAPPRGLTPLTPLTPERELVEARMDDQHSAKRVKKAARPSQKHQSNADNISVTETRPARASTRESTKKRPREEDTGVSPRPKRARTKTDNGKTPVVAPAAPRGRGKAKKLKMNWDHEREDGKRYSAKEYRRLFPKEFAEIYPEYVNVEIDQ